MADDIFDEDADEIDIERKEWEKLCTARKKEGFRDGVSHGQDIMLQKGFNDGFTQNTKSFHSLSRMKGFLCGFIDSNQVNETHSLPPSLVTKLEELLQKISDTEQSWLQDCGKSRDVGTDDSPDGSTISVGDNGNSADILCPLDDKMKEMDMFRKELAETLKEHNLPC